MMDYKEFKVSRTEDTTGNIVGLIVGYNIDPNKTSFSNIQAVPIIFASYPSVRISKMLKNIYSNVGCIHNSTKSYIVGKNRVTIHNVDRIPGGIECGKKFFGWSFSYQDDYISSSDFETPLDFRNGVASVDVKDISDFLTPQNNESFLKTLSLMDTESNKYKTLELLFEHIEKIQNQPSKLDDLISDFVSYTPNLSLRLFIGFLTFTNEQEKSCSNRKALYEKTVELAKLKYDDEQISLIFKGLN